MLAEPVDRQIEIGLGRIADLLGADRATVLQGSPDGRLLRTHQWVRPGWPGVAEPEHTSEFPWSVERVFRAREPVAFAWLDELPPAAAPDREAFERLGIMAGVALPMIIDERVIGTLVFGVLRAPRRWPSELVNCLGLVSELVASTLARHRADQELRAALPRGPLLPPERLPHHAPTAVRATGGNRRQAVPGVASRALRTTGSVVLRSVSRELLGADLAPGRAWSLVQIAGAL
jgi:GAF domain-containing protein